MRRARAVEVIHRVLAEEFGWEFSGHRLREVEETARVVAREAQIPDLDSLARALLQPGKGRKRILDLLTPRLSVSETSFFRDAPIFHLLENKVLPRLIRRRAKTGRRLRVWSAGCCTGEEAYSLAIALSRCLPAGEPWDVEVLGTDLNPDSIQHAEKGVYGNWAFRGAPGWLKKTCFREIAPRSFQVQPEARSNVRFLTHNLIDGLPPSVNLGKIDLLFCRNVLMYFSAEKTGRTLEALRSALANDGVLCVAPYESVRLKANQFEPADPFAGAFFQPHRQGDRLSEADYSPHAVTAVPRPVRKKVKPAKRFRVEDPVRRCLAEPKKRPEPVWRSGPQLSPKESRAPVDPFQEVRVLAGEGRLWEALHRCDDLVVKNRLNPEAYYLRATILLEGGRGNDAAGALRQTLYLRPNCVSAHLTLATIARNRGRHEEADRTVSCVRQMLSSRPPAEPVPASDGLTVAALLAMLPAQKAL